MSDSVFFLSSFCFAGFALRHEHALPFFGEGHAIHLGLGNQTINILTA